MAKFYVYTSKIDDNKSYDYIPESSIEDFATNNFNPSIAMFTGIVVEANNYEDAIEVYHNPGCNRGEYLLADEPKATIEKRLFWSLAPESRTAATSINLIRCILLLKLAASKLKEASDHFSQMSELLHDTYNNPDHMPPTKIFDTISSEYIRQLIKYNGDTKKS